MEARMKRFLLALAIVIAAIAAPSVAAGGWATVGLSSLPPSGLESNQAWPVDITVLQHGQTPLAGLVPVVRVRDGDGTIARTFTAEPTDRSGVYHAEVTFPGAGTYSYEVYDGFSEYGGAQTHTFTPVEIGAAGGSLPFLVVGLVAALALGLVAAALVYRRHDRPSPLAATNLEKAA
jgi:hypothetical protein